MSNEVLQTKVFREWLGGLADETAKGAIAARIVRMQSGLLGDFKAVGGKVLEFRIDVSKGYRLYATRTGKTVILLLNGGHKKGQSADITAAQDMVATMEKAKKEGAKKRKK